jgi:hypothetical protein
MRTTAAGGGGRDREPAQIWTQILTLILVDTDFSHEKYRLAA